MLISKLLSKLNLNIKYEILNEQEFDTLALTASEIEISSCVFLDNVKYLPNIRDNVTMLITSPDVSKMIEEFPGYSGGLCVVDNPRILFFRLHNFLANSADYARRRFDTTIGENCQISNLASISDSNVSIGNNVIIEEFVVIRENTVIGDNCIIRAGAKIGGQGFEFKRQEDDILSVEHLGGVILGNHVEIQYNTCVDRAVYPWDNTMIGDFCKIDNLVHVAHAVKIKENVMVVAQSGIGGRVEIEPNTWVGFGATISNGLKIGESARANIGAVVTKNIDAGNSVSGNFAIKHERFLENLKKSVQ